MELATTLIIGIVIGLVFTLLVTLLRRPHERTLAQELMREAENRQARDLEAVIERIRDSFGALSLDALSKNTQEFLRLANETLSKQTQMGGKELEEKKKLIDQTLVAIKEDLQRVQTLVTDFEKDREKKFGELTSNLQSTALQISALQETTNQLRTALSSTKARGQWGERMAEDVLALAGFIEGVNYVKQRALESVGSRPDYTFLLPQKLRVNMDVKFPLDNYMRYLEEAGEAARESFKKRFLADVRQRIKEVTTRDYINPEENTIDFVIVFIPNEQIYAFLNEHDRALMDEALKSRVVLCSPLTLYAILAVIRQAVDNFNLEKTAAEILSLLGAFKKQWDNFTGSLEKMGKKIDEARDEFQRLTTTRRNKLEQPLRKIEDLRRLKAIAPLELPENEAALPDEEEETSSEDSSGHAEDQSTGP
jgi:DNA recombination protein RmuC